MIFFRTCINLGEDELNVLYDLCMVVFFMLGPKLSKGSLNCILLTFTKNRNVV